MFSVVSSPLALKGQLKLSITTTDLLVVVFILALYVTNCEARHLRVHGNEHCSSKLTSLQQPKQGVMGGAAAAAKGNMRSSSEILVGSKMDASMVNKALTTVAKKEVAPSGDSCPGSLTRALEAINKVRPSGIGERSVLGAGGDGSNSDQVGSNTTATYTAETLVAMDYLDVQPAPPVHNR